MLQFYNIKGRLILFQDIGVNLVLESLEGRSERSDLWHVNSNEMICVGGRYACSDLRIFFRRDEGIELITK